MKLIFGFMVFLCAFSSTLSIAQTAPEAKPCDAKPEWVMQLSKPDEGWDTSFVDRTHKLGHESAPMASPPELASVTEADYAVRGRYFTWTEVVVDPCDHSARLKTRQLLIEHVYGYSRNGRTFAFGVYGNCGSLENRVWHAAACDTGALLVDTTGKGKFDLLRFGRWAPTDVPGWVGK